MQIKPAQFQASDLYAKWHEQKRRRRFIAQMEKKLLAKENEPKAIEKTS